MKRSCIIVSLLLLELILLGGINASLSDSAFLAEFKNQTGYTLIEPDRIDLTLKTDLAVYVIRNGEMDKRLISWHAGVITNIGKDFIEQQLAGSASTTVAKYISVSTSSSSPSASWTQIPSEIASGGLTRAIGTYTSTGTGAWKISITFTATASHTGLQLAGCNYGTSGDNNLFASDTFTSTNLNINDQLILEFSFSC